MEVGVRELKNNLSRYLDRVADGDEVIVTDRGRPVARITTAGDDTQRLAGLVDAGIVRAPTVRGRVRPALVASDGSVSDYVDDQRR